MDDIENGNLLISLAGAKMHASLFITHHQRTNMSLLEYVPIGLAVTGLALRYMLSKPSARAVQAWEAALAGNAETALPAPATTARIYTFATV